MALAKVRDDCTGYGRAVLAVVDPLLCCVLIRVLDNVVAESVS